MYIIKCNLRVPMTLVRNNYEYNKAIREGDFWIKSYYIECNTEDKVNEYINNCAPDYCKIEVYKTERVAVYVKENTDDKFYTEVYNTIDTMSQEKINARLDSYYEGSGKVLGEE